MPPRISYAYVQPNPDAADPDAYILGESPLPRKASTIATVGTQAQRLHLAFFTAAKTETCTRIRIQSGNSIATNATLIRLAVYSVAPETGALSLVTATPNDLTMLQATQTRYVRNLASPFEKEARKRYALGILIVGATPNLNGASVHAGESAESPRITGSLTGQADLPASILDSELGTIGNIPMIGVLP